MARKKKTEPTEPRTWIVPMRIERNVDWLVAAEDEEGARSAADAGKCDEEYPCGETVNWNVRGTPKENV